MKLKLKLKLTERETEKSQAGALKLSPLQVLRVNKLAAHFQAALMESLGTWWLTFPPPASQAELNLDLRSFLIVGLFAEQFGFHSANP